MTAAAAKTLAGAAAFALAPALFEIPREGTFGIDFYLLSILAFGAAAGLLLLGGRKDPAAVALGGAFLVLASTYSNWPLGVASGLAEPLRPPLRAAWALHTDAFLPFFFWLFARRFPPGVRGLQRTLRWGIAVSALAGGSLFLFNLALFPGHVAGEHPSRPWVEALTAWGSPYYLVLLLLLAGAFGALTWKMRTAQREAGRRARLFGAALLLGLGPFLLTALATIFSSAAREIVETDPLFRHTILPLVALGFLSVPFTTAYAVLVNKVLEIHLIARRALQYLMARTTVLALTAVPLAFLAVYFVQYRHQSLVEIFSGRRLLLPAGAAALGVLALRYRQSALDRIDRLFFRDRYDVRHTLSDLVQRARNSRDEGELADLLVHGIDQALHLSGISLLLEDPREGTLADPHGRLAPLDASCPLARLAARAPEPLDADPDDPRSLARRLPAADQRWLAETGVRLLVPLTSSDGSLLGALALGEKKSGLPFLGEDRELLCTLATSAALVLEARFRRAPIAAGEGERERAVRPHRGARNARECRRCRHLFLPETRRCPRCDELLVAAGVPYLLPGKFRFEERLGRGGMGVVYRAVDLALGRQVAVKTLRNLSPDHALRLRREAQTAAAVSHPHLASVYGLETWGGTPLLIMELMEGTLAQRLRRGPLPVAETVELGVAMAQALERLHEHEILHRDLKPSNIGYSADGVPKLTDFGIARLQYDLRREDDDLASAEASRLPPTSIWNIPSTGSTPREIVGTLAYLPPEIFLGARFDPGVDLWGLALVLWECLRGERAFATPETGADLVAVAREREVPDIREHVPDCPEPLALLLAAALHRDRERRPATAGDFARRLRAALPAG